MEQGGKGLASLDYAEEEVFLCGDHICVNSSSVCDGRIDCHNGADEHHDCPGNSALGSPLHFTLIDKYLVIKPIKLFLFWAKTSKNPRVEVSPLKIVKINI